MREILSRVSIKKKPFWLEWRGISFLSGSSADNRKIGPLPLPHLPFQSINASLTPLNEFLMEEEEEEEDGEREKAANHALLTLIRLPEFILTPRLPCLGSTDSLLEPLSTTWLSI